MDWSVFFTVFLSSGLAVAGAEAWLRFHYDQRYRRKEYLGHQLQLYGPIFALTAQNRDTFGRVNSILDQGNATDVAVANSHIRQVIIPNCDRVEEELRKNPHFLDPEDIPLVIQFFHHQNNRRVEGSSGKGTTLSIQLVRELGRISYMPPQFIERFEQKFQTKQKQPREMLGHGWGPRRSVPAHPACKYT